MSTSLSKIVLFHRNFRGFTGGHLKVWHYFNHVRAAPCCTPKIYFTEVSRWDQANPWWQCHEEIVKTWIPADADVLFLGGLDWTAVPEAFRDEPPIPIINIVQGFGHMEPDDPRYDFLRHRAIRVCVNPKVEEALRAVPGVNGPIFHVPMGLDHTSLPQPTRNGNDLVIAAVKAPELGAALYAKLQRPSRRVELLTKPLPRRDYLQKIADSSVAVFLPLPKEGFYLPLLEAMAMRRIVVCPDCVSNRVYCFSGHNGFRPAYTAAAIEGAAEAALALPEEDARAMSDNAAETAAAYTLDRERDAFLKILSNLDSLWNR